MRANVAYDFTCRKGMCTDILYNTVEDIDLYILIRCVLSHFMCFVCISNNARDSSCYKTKGGSEQTLEFAIKDGNRLYNIYACQSNAAELLFR